MIVEVIRCICLGLSRRKPLSSGIEVSCALHTRFLDKRPEMSFCIGVHVRIIEPGDRNNLVENRPCC